MTKNSDSSKKELWAISLRRDTLKRASKDIIFYPEELKLSDRFILNTFFKCLSVKNELFVVSGTEKVYT